MTLDRVLIGRIVAPEQTFEGWVGVQDGRIAATGAGDPPAARKVDDHGEKLILPGVVDGQTHATSYRGLAGIGETTASAIAGGVTTLVDMPYDNPLPLDRPERLADKVAAIDRYAHADMALYGTVTAETATRHVNALIDGGVSAFKISSFESSPTRFPRIAADLMLDLMEALAQTDLPLGLHNEDQEIVLARVAAAKARGENGIEAHATSRPLAAELAATAQFHALGAATGAHTHPVHLTHEDGFALTAQFAATGARATGELCVHYLWFDAARDGETLGARMKVNPPIRAGAIDGLWAALLRGEVAFISSDHSSWPIDNKLTGSIFEAGAGVPGVETLLPAFYTVAKAQGLDAPRETARYLCSAPARFFGIAARKGAIEPGRDADFAVIEDGCFPWNEARSHDGLNWSPYHGHDFAARCAATYLRGDLVWDGKDILNAPGRGSYVRRTDTGWFAR